MRNFASLEFKNKFLTAAEITSFRAGFFEDDMSHCFLSSLDVHKSAAIVTVDTTYTYGRRFFLLKLF
jgi:hypothetical protein